MGMTIDLTYHNINCTKELNEIAARYKKKYTEFVDKYSVKYGSNYLWWSLPFSSRNIFLDSTFENMCYLLLCKDMLHSDKEIDKIIVDDKALYHTIRINYKKEILEKKIALVYKLPKSKAYPVMVRVFQAISRLIMEWFCVKCYTRNVQYDIKESISIIDTPILSSSFVDGEYQDRYFNSIRNYTDQNIYYVPSLNKNSSVKWKKFIRDIVQSQAYRFILKEKYLSVFDYLFLLKYVVYCLFLSLKKYEYEDLNVTPLIKTSLMKGCCCIPSLKGVLNYRFIKNIKKEGFKVNNLISWYEGRPSEIMIQMAFRMFFPNVNSVGYIGYPHTEFALSQYISDEQYRQKAAPLKMTIPGAIYERQARQFCKKVKLIKVPILRYKYTYSLDRANNNSHYLKKNMLVILPYFIDLAENMLHILNEYMKLYPDCFNIIIKNHPVNIDKKVNYYLKEKIFFTPSYVEGDLTECLENIDIAYISYSTASLEVLLKGVYLVNLCPVGRLMMSGIPEDINDKLFEIVYGEKEVFKVFDAYVQEKKKTLQLLNIAEILEPVNEETINRMWN